MATIVGDDNSMDIDEEPVGIVISRGKRDEPAPTFWAYVWSSLPEEELSQQTESRAA